jgi:formylglycine-generating enzyme required for sulfatase activity
MTASGYQTERERGKATTAGVVYGTAERPSKFTWDAPGFQQGDEHPVTCVTYQDARAYCQWLSETCERSFRLPTTAEWQYVCLYGSDTGYDFDPASNPERYVNVIDASLAKVADKLMETQFDDGFVYTAPVKAKRPGRNGLSFMHGNVEEWCRNLEELNDADLRGTIVVARGGSWLSPLKDCAGVNRIRSGEHVGTNTVGFRIVCEAKTPTQDGAP